MMIQNVVPDRTQKLLEIAFSFHQLHQQVSVVLVRRPPLTRILLQIGFNLTLQQISISRSLNREMKLLTMLQRKNWA